MPKVKLKGKPQEQFMIGNRFECGGSIVNFTAEEMKNHSDVIFEHLEFNIPPLEPKKYTEDELFMLTRTEQISLLKSFGVKDIPKTETERVKAILGAQK